VTTVVGVIPLIGSSAIWAPIAYTIIFGLLFSTVLTLILVPILYKKFFPKDT
jgi:multidrug efflux pump subunit AcrB